MRLSDYQAKALKTAFYGLGNTIIYPALGLAGEAGEVANKVKKVLRDEEGNFTYHNKAAIADEVGDCLWYCAAIARDLGMTLDEIAQNNLDKLERRRQNNTLSGSGDGR